jgi:hypothetical protein
MADLTWDGSTADWDVTGREPRGEEGFSWCSLTVAMLFWRLYLVSLTG